MSFDDSVITERRVEIVGDLLLISWTATSPSRTIFQVYIDRALAWHGATRWVSLPLPDRRVRIDVGAVGPGEEMTDFSSSLPSLILDRLKITWRGGSYLDPTGDDDVRAFRIYGEATPGGGIDYASPLAEIEAYEADILDGYGLGGYGHGGWGRAASDYSWESSRLKRGTWNFGITTVDQAGNEGSPMTTSITVVAPPAPPAANDDASRLRYAYDQATKRISLSWNASPG